MVFPGEEEEEEDYTTTGHDTPNKKKKKTLHNFSFTDLKWGAQRNLRCTKIESNVVAVDQRPRRSKLGDNRSHGGAEGIEEEAKGEDHEEEKTSKKEGEREVSPPWNLRKRRAACKAPVTDSEGIQKEEEENGVRPKFNPTLTKKEVEDDFIAMTGHKPPRRPKKRPRNVQKQIDVLHPASYFVEVTKDLYDVPDVAENGKK
ncbi:hypothetical protein IGI04_028421 [Brassica rapa subsp. trilocularis]|uniref:Uncharacterized protein n=1 Tax=Brassica rapa subsp. trilocularis TaxID=1813537 RepID=A0ABQ7L4S1_BRACM|nr:hypothetical protein IGI04_028421 [Brassica rapa subsp. trilocularis]